MKQHIDIIGAGIGGLTAALALQKINHSITLYESAAEIKPVGAGIILANNAMQVLKKLEVFDRIKATGHYIGIMKITDTFLKPLSIVNLKSFEEKYCVHSVAIHRGTLQKILAESVGLTNIHFSKRLSQVKKDGTKTQAFFEDGTHISTDVLVGADGIKSVVRKDLFPAVTIRNARQFCWRGIAEMELPQLYQHEVIEAWGKGRRFGFVQIDHRKVYWYALTNEDESVAAENIADVFKEFHEVIASIIKATPPTQIITSSITDLAPFHQWSNAQVCLFGDAAHATTPNLGQGACQAMEDAYTLSRVLSKESNISKAFETYNQKRLAKAHLIVKRSWQLGQLAHTASKPGLWLRDVLMRYTPASFNQRQLETIFKLTD